MKAITISVASAVMVSVLCVASLADQLTIVTGSGKVYTVGESDLSGTGLISTHDFGKSIYSAVGDYDTGDIVLGFVDGTAAVVKYDALGTVLTSGTIGDGSGVTGVSIRPNGELYFTNLTGWAYARARSNVTAAPAGYTLPANLQFMSGASPYLYVATTPQDEALFIASDRKETWIRQGNDMSSVPAGYLNDHIVWDSYLTAWGTLSSGDVVLASGFSWSAKVFVRDKSDMSALPSGYVGDAGDVSGVTFGTGARVKAFTRTDDDILVIGNDSAQVFLRSANDLRDDTIDGYASTYTSGFPWGPSAMAITSNDNVVIGLFNGWVIVRSLYDIDGLDLEGPQDFTTGGDLPVVAIFNMPDVTGGPTCEQTIAQGNVLTGDFNRDCHVDIQDLSVLVQDWTKCNDPNNDSCVW